jgi:hypothetical protein
MENQVTISLSLSIDEVNGILNLLGQQPFVQVQPLIAKIQSQASPQVVAQAPVEETEKAGGTD